MRARSRPHRVEFIDLPHCVGYVPGAAWAGRPTARGEMNTKHEYVILAVAVVSMYSAVAVAQSPPLEVKGVPLGASMAELQAKIPGFTCAGSKCQFSLDSYTRSECGPFSTSASYNECYHRAVAATDFGPAHVLSYTAEFRDNKLGRMSLSVGQIFIDRIVIALTEKYGTPTSDIVKPIQNRAGATFGNRVAIWERPDGSIKVEQRNASIDYGAVIISTKAFDEAALKEFVEKAKASASRL